MIVVTAIYGGYDELRPHIHHPGVDRWICYTDDPALACPGWEIIVEDLGFEHPRVAAKWRKCNPPPADQSIWTDGSASITTPDFIDYCLGLLEEADMALHPHPDRDNIRDEAEASFQLEWKKYGGLPLHPQVDRYEKRKPDLPALGLWQTTVFARNHTTAVIQMGAAWFQHCDLLTYQDQLSLPVLLDDYGITVEPLDGDPLKNPYWRWYLHAKKD